MLARYLAVAVGGTCVAAGAWGLHARNGGHVGSNRVTITILDTTDSHGHIMPWDYYANKPANLGLAKIATLVKEQRAQSPDALLLDCGDTTEGTPLAFLYGANETGLPNPEIAVFNAMHYDAMAVGNHEFNYGEPLMWKAKAESHFPWLAANLKQTYSSGVPYIQPYIIREVQGVRVGIVGFVTPGVVRWEVPEHYEGYTFEPIVESAQKVIPEVRKQSDLVVVIMHSGIDRDPKNGTMPLQENPEDNAAWEVAEQVPGIDVIFYGHTHLEMPELFVNGVLMAQAKNWGISLARADIMLEKDPVGGWTVESKHSKTIPVMPATEADPEIVKIAEPYHEATQRYLDTPIAASERALSGETERYEDGPLVELINRAQMDAAHADVSMATMFYPGIRVPAGTVTIRDVAALYTYENVLYAVEISGAQLKEALEHAASLYTTWPPPGGQAMQLPGYSADVAEGVGYVMDLTQPAGQRIRNLQFQGKSLLPEQKLRLAINNYRYTGGGHYDVYRGLPIVYRSPVEIRELVIEYLMKTKKIPPSGDGNWKIIPAEAVTAMEKASAEQEAGKNR